MKKPMSTQPNSKVKTNILKFLGFSGLMSLPLLSFSADPKPFLSIGDTAWILTCTALVLFMIIPGLALFYAGLVRSKNVLSVLMQCFAITCLISIIWFAIGYSIALGDGGGLNAFWGGLDHMFGKGIELESLTTVDKASGRAIPTILVLMFQMTFAIITPALIVGSFAERMKFSSMLWFTAAWSILVYAPSCHWVWGGGFLKDTWDLAGGSVVHINAGVAALVAAIMLGKRKGFPNTAMPPHNLTMTVAGAAMLWVGWFGFNAGSGLMAGNAAAMTLLVTHLGAATGSLAWMFMEWKKFGKPSVLGIVTGMVAGLGTITPASGVVGPFGAIIIGFTAGVVCFYATQFLRRRLKIDDSLDVMPVHGVGGILGLLLAAVFGLTLDGFQKGVADAPTISSQLGTQALTVIVSIVWCVVMTYIILKVIDITIGLRVTEDEENEGLDIVLHEEKGYNF